MANDAGDLAEMYQGVRDGMKLTAEQERTLEDRIIIYRDTTHTGEGFTSLARRLVVRHQPDMAWADPLLNYIGDDISEQRVIAEFCCNRLNAIALETGVIWCLLHHTGKPSKDPKATEHWTASDLAYSGLGSSALVNWSRETAVLLRVKTPDGQPPTFQLSMTKRRKRAGLRDVNGDPADTIFLRHSGHDGICWEQCISPISEGKPGRYKPGGEPGRDSAFDATAFQQVLANFGGEVSRKNEKEIAIRLGISIRSVWSYWKEFKKSATANVAAAILAALFAATMPTKACCNNALQPLQESEAPATCVFSEGCRTAARMLQVPLQQFTSCRATAAKTPSPEPPSGVPGIFAAPAAAHQKRRPAVGDDYAKRQTRKDEAHAHEYRAWIASLPPDERRRMAELGLAEPLIEADGYGWGNTNAADFPEASEKPRLPIEAEEVPVEVAAIENETVLDILRRLIGELLAERNARLSLECLALATGFSYLGGTMTDIARRHCVTRAAVSKRCVELTERLHLLPSRAMRSLTARRAYQAAQLSSRKDHERFGNHQS